jgi:hypothetical protein
VACLWSRFYPSWPNYFKALFPNNDTVFQDSNVPFAQLEVVRHGLKSRKVNLTIFSDHRCHHICVIFEPLCSVLETGVRNKFPPPTSLKPLEGVLQEEWYSGTHCSKLIRIHYKKECGCIQDTRWPNTILIKRCVQCV